MIYFVLLPVFIKAFSTALTVGLAAWLARSGGPFWGAVAASLPVSAGPAYVFLSLQHDAAFVASSALASAVANAGTAVFLAIYALAGTRPLRHGLGVSVVGWTAMQWLLARAEWTVLSAVVLNLGVYGACFAATRNLSKGVPRYTAARSSRRSGARVQMLVVAVFVVGLTTLSDALGSALTGTMSVFPISLASVIVISRPIIGPHATVHLAAIALRTMLGFSIAFVGVHLGTLQLGQTVGLFIGVSICLAWALAMIVVRMGCGFQFRAGR